MERSTIYQTLYTTDNLPSITLQCGNLDALTEDSVREFLETASESLIGIAGGYDATDESLAAFALASNTQILVITLQQSWETDPSGKEYLENNVLRSESCRKFGWNMSRLATGLHDIAGLRVAMAFDIRQQNTNKNPAGSIGAIQAILHREDMTLDKPNAAEIFQDEKFNEFDREKLALRAWAACRVAQVPGSKSTIKPVPPIDTTSFTEERIAFLAKAVRDSERLQSMKPLTIKNEVDTNVAMVDGLLQITSTRYKSRIRKKQNYLIETSDGSTIPCKAVFVEGKTAKLELSEEVEIESIVSLVSAGKDDFSNAEMQRRRLLTRALQNGEQLMDIPFVQMIWFPSIGIEQITWPIAIRDDLDGPIDIEFDKDLNDSQVEAVEHALNRGGGTDRITMIIGPPGTGKTTVIAATVMGLISGTETDTIWIVAQSNVAVKNIAEKLVDCDFLDFKLLVSQEFITEWHDHLYNEIRANVLPSTEFGDNDTDNAALLGDARVLLCTLSMFSNRGMSFDSVVPIHTVIVDEASQIECGDYIPLLVRSSSTLQKLVFIGDDKQLAPFGQDQIEDIKSIFEFSHLRQREIFLDTQYRMPHFIGDFLSEHVYSGHLKTTHKIASKLSCRLVDVYHSREEQPPDGTSWINYKEVDAVVLIAKKYKKENRKYRVITPYDAQRDAIEKALRAERLKWEDCVFNVDSFQGNEEDHIIISLVRTGGLGFLKNERRMNVMLSRCRLGMLICSSKKFLLRKDVGKTLCGQLAMHCIEKSGEEEAWITWDRLRKADWP